MNSSLEKIILEQKQKQVKEELENKRYNGKPKYCTEDVGLILYNDKLAAIEKYEIVAGIFRRYGNNYDFNEDIVSDISKFKKDKSIIDLEIVEEFPYNKNYLNILNSINISKDNYRLCGGITEKGYVEISDKYEISSDLKTTYGFSIIKNDIKNTILASGNKPVKLLTYVESKYCNSINFLENERILIIGSDLGYLGYLANLKNCNIDMYEEDEELFSFLDEYVYKKLQINISLNNNPNYNEYDKIILTPNLSTDLQMKYFFDLELFKYENVYSYLKDLIICKFKSDLRDIIITDKNQVIDTLLDSHNEMDGINQLILPVQLDFAEKCEKYLNDNKIYLFNYKKWQRLIRDNNIIYNILKTEI